MTENSQEVKPAKALSTFSVLYRILARDIQVALRRQSDVAAVFFFFIIAASLFPLGSGADPKLLSAMAPSVLWVMALLSCMLSLSRMFSSDYADGTLEQMMISNQPVVLIVLMKILAHWILSGLPLVFVAPLIGLQFNLGGAELQILAASLLMGTLALSLIGSIGAALTLGIRGTGVLIAILVLPLYIPVLVFGAGAVNAVSIGMSPNGALSLLGAVLSMALVFAPLASAAALKIALE
ncbi:MAG TPA: heme exporter protein CcmB [Methylotenera sp.]|nr:heme exporter protein CcmB [Methylotenera sp.]HPV44330.1 heme exporter protein CcmB [Methylotenera sp.]